MWVQPRDQGTALIPRRGSQAPAYGLAVLLAGAGMTHFAVPGFYDAIVPCLLIGPQRTRVLGSGIAELVCARPAVERAVAYGRLPVRIPPVLWARSVRRGASRWGC